MADLPAGVQGYWSLWRIGIGLADWRRQRTLPHFLHFDGRVLIPTARRLWDRLLEALPQVQGYTSGEQAAHIYQQAYASAATQGKAIYDELTQAHHQQLHLQQAKGEYAFAARRRALERIGLPEVCNYRLTQLAQEEATWRKTMTQRAQARPELTPLLLLAVVGEAV